MEGGRGLEDTEDSAGGALLVLPGQLQLDRGDSHRQKDLSRGEVRADSGVRLAVQRDSPAPGARGDSLAHKPRRLVQGAHTDLRRSFSRKGDNRGARLDVRASHRAHLPEAHELSEGEDGGPSQDRGRPGHSQRHASRDRPRSGVLPAGHREKAFGVSQGSRHSRKHSPHLAHGRGIPGRGPGAEAEKEVRQALSQQRVRNAPGGEPGSQKGT